MAWRVPITLDAIMTRAGVTIGEREGAQIQQALACEHDGLARISYCRHVESRGRRVAQDVQRNGLSKLKGRLELHVRRICHESSVATRLGYAKDAGAKYPMLRVNEYKQPTVRSGEMSKIGDV
eukprot:6179457-Pleurochrysis_carterae.AAC.2